MVEQTFYDEYYCPPPRTRPRSPEWLFSVRCADGMLVDCELRYHGEYGVEAHFLRDNQFCYSWRFATRALAIEWAEQERAALLVQEQMPL